MTRAMLSIGILVTSLLVGQSHALAQLPLGSEFTYQGRILKDDVPVNDTCDFEFSLFEDAGGASQVGSTQTILGVPVTNGLFTVELNSGNNFGPTAFVGDERWLLIAVKCPPDVSFTPLSPLQPVTPAPYALALPGLRTTPSGDASFPDSPNVIGGHRDNNIGAGVAGATISGGGSTGFGNSVTANFAIVGGGAGNTASGFRSTVGGGSSGTASGVSSTVGGGGGNTSSGDLSTVGGGLNNTSSGSFGTVGGGQTNTSSDLFGTVGGGGGNTGSGFASTVGGGQANTASSFASTVGGGEANIASGARATVPGGSFNFAGGDFSFAAGNRAKANHDGTFVWADSIVTDFASTGPNQFLIRATGGVGIGTNSPAAQLDVMGGVRIEEAFAGATILELAIARRWEFRQLGEGAGTALELASLDSQGISNKDFIINTTGEVGIGTTTPSFTLEVNGSAGKPGGGSWTNSSDRRLKKNILDLDGTLEKMLALRGVTFEYKDADAINELHGTRIGMIAQEVEKVFPDWVSEGGHGYKTLTFRGFEALTVEALRELRDEKHAEIALLRSEKDREIEQLRMVQNREIASLRAQNEELEQRFTKLESMVSRLGAQNN